MRTKASVGKKLEPTRKWERRFCSSSGKKCLPSGAEHETNLHRLGVQAFEPPDGFWEKLDHLPGCASRPASRREGSLTENASKSRSGLQSGAQGSRHGEPRATTICRYCQVGGRPHRATGESHAALGMRLAGWSRPKSPILLSEGYPVRCAITRSISENCGNVADSPPLTGIKSH